MNEQEKINKKILDDVFSEDEKIQKIPKIAIALVLLFIFGSFFALVYYKEFLSGSTKNILLTNDHEINYTDDNDSFELDNDFDQDGLSDKEEKKYGTNYKIADTDGDGYSDWEEIQNGFNPLGDGKMSNTPNIEGSEFIENNDKITALDDNKKVSFFASLISIIRKGGNSNISEKRWGIGTLLFIFLMTFLGFFVKLFFSSIFVNFAANIFNFESDLQKILPVVAIPIAFNTFISLILSLTQVFFTWPGLALIFGLLGWVGTIILYFVSFSQKFKTDFIDTLKVLLVAYIFIFLFSMLLSVILGFLGFFGMIVLFGDRMFF